MHEGAVEEATTETPDPTPVNDPPASAPQGDGDEGQSETPAAE